MLIIDCSVQCVVCAFCTCVYLFVGCVRLCLLVRFYTKILDHSYLRIPLLLNHHRYNLILFAVVIVIVVVVDVAANALVAFCFLFVCKCVFRHC